MGEILSGESGKVSRNKEVNKKIVLIILIAVTLIGGFFVFNNFIYDQKQANVPAIIESYEGTLSGKYVCLPHKDTSGVQTTECVSALKTDVGEFYALDFNLITNELLTLQYEERISVNGIITPIEKLSSDYWQRYDVEGIISVKEIIK